MMGDCKYTCLKPIFYKVEYSMRCELVYSWKTETFFLLITVFQPENCNLIFQIGNKKIYYLFPFSVFHHFDMMHNKMLKHMHRSIVKYHTSNESIQARRRFGAENQP